MISRAQSIGFRQRASKTLQEVFATTVGLLGTPDIPAARWSKSVGGQHESLGIMPVCDISFRLKVADIPGGLAAIIPTRTRIVEDGKTYRIDRIRTALGDDCAVLECYAI